MGLSSCEPYEEYLTDFDYSTVYFPYQQPVRTVIVGEEESFHVGVVLGGKRENNNTETVTFDINSDTLTSDDSPWKDMWELLPEEYYTLSHDSVMVIESGSYQGLVKVTLTDAFFDDSKALGNHYALPFIIKNATVDSVITGTDNGDVQAKDYMIPVIKYISSMEGNWYHHGIDSTFDANEVFVERDVYANQDMIDNDVWKLTTTAPYKVSTQGIGASASSKGKLIITLSENDNLLIESMEGSQITDISTVSTVYNRNKNQMLLNYHYTDTESMIHHVSDTLTFRNRDMKLELW